MKPEKGIGSDLGVELLPVDVLKIGLRRIFMNNVDDLIAENTVSSNPSQSKGVNAGKAISKGIEISMEHYPVDLPSGLRILPIHPLKSKTRSIQIRTEQIFLLSRTPLPI